MKAAAKKYGRKGEEEEEEGDVQGRKKGGAENGAVQRPLFLFSPIMFFNNVTPT